MVKIISVFSFLPLFLIFLSCNQQGANSQEKAQIDSLQSQIKNIYKPDLGEFMLSIQMHHAKLWFAGEAQNWKLADYELHEMEECFDDVKTYCSARPEVKSVGMITLPMDSLSASIKLKNEASFKSNFLLL